MTVVTGQAKRKKRTWQVRARLKKNLPRLSVFRSNRYIRAQIIDDKQGATMASAVGPFFNRARNQTRQDVAKKVGEVLAKFALDKKIKRVVFDRGRYKYHGLVQALAEGAREGGLKF